VVEQFQLFSLGSVLVILGLVVLIFSIKPRISGTIGIILLGPLPIMWGGRNKSILVILIIAMLLFALLPLVFIL